MPSLSKSQTTLIKATAVAWVVILGACIALVLAHALANPPLFP